MSMKGVEWGQREKRRGERKEGIRERVGKEKRCVKVEAGRVGAEGTSMMEERDSSGEE